MSAPAVAQPAESMDVSTRSIINAYTLAELSSASYTDDGFSRRNELAQMGFQEVAYLDYDDEEDVQVVFAQSPTNFVVAVRGTEGAEDFFTDLKIGQYQVDWFSGDLQVHNGFNDSARVVYSQVRARVRTAQAQGRRVFITGHSLGGAVAQILALRLTLDGNKPAGVYTFGSPRVGDTGWKSNYESRLSSITHRFVNEGDPIPCHPVIERRWEFAGPTHWMSTGAVNWNYGKPNCSGPRTDYHGIAKYVAKLRNFVPLTYDTPVFRRPASIVSIGAPNAPFKTSTEVWRHNTWNEDWLAVEPYTIGSTTFMARFKSSGLLRLQRMEASGALGAQIAEHTLNGVTAIAATRNVTSNPWLYMLTTSAEVWGYPLRSDGTLCIGAGCASPRVVKLGELVGITAIWSPFTNLEVSGDLMLLSSRFGGGQTVTIDLRSNTLLSSVNVGAGVAASRIVIYGFNIFLFQQNEATGRLQVRSVGWDGKIGALLKNYAIPTGFTQLHSFYPQGGGVGVFMLSGGTGELRTYSLNTDGSLLALTDSRFWTIGWQTTTTFHVGGKPFVFSVKQ